VGTDTGAKPATSSKSSKTNLSKGHDTDSANPLVPNTTASASTSLTAQAQASAMGAQSVQQAASDPDKAADTGPESSGAQTQAVGGASTPATGPGGWKVGSNPVLSEGDDNENPGDASGPDASSGTAALSSTASGAIASALADAHASPAALADPGSKLVHAAFSASIGAESAQTLAAGAGQSNSVSTSTLPSTTASASVAAPVSSDQFGSEAATKILYFVQNGVQSAQLSLNPAHLGPMDVQIRVNGDQVNLALSAAQPETRHALEMSLPKLREMFSEQGIQLGDLSVGARGFANSGGQQQYAASQRLAGGSTKAPDAGAIAGDSPVTVRSLQLVDTFA
jgi:flagellar hook-length control protein FliK